MPDASSLIIFILASLLLLVTPGPAVLYVVTRSIAQGRVAGIVSALGIAVGGLVHVLFAAAGISAIFASSAVAFSVVKYLGAAYLVYLGVRKLFFKVHPIVSEESKETVKISHLFTKGVIVNLLNPKVALFFFAFLPQFVHPGGAPVTIQIMFLGAIFVGMGICNDSVYAFLSGTLGQWLRRNRHFARAEGYVTGTIYVALGLVTAASGGNNTHK